MKIDSLKYKVSFNICIGDEEVGEQYLRSIDFAGDDMRELAREVVLDDPNYPLVFQESTTEPNIVGRFYSAEGGDYCLTAIMFKDFE